MKKINHSFLIVSIASALVILGGAVAFGLQKGIIPGLLLGVGAFAVLISCMLIVNAKLNKGSDSHPVAQDKDDTEQDDT